MYLFIGSDGAEDNFGKSLGREHSEANAANHTRIFDEGETLVLRIENQARDVLLWHTRELFKQIKN